jgi:NADPH-dependent glutamate synthase beta subunit-like oxidoreductase/dihydroorotate dehydrogenase/Pyruvate/2-oxoacid:ferredoxin oxidoreductase delta subunit
MEMKHLPEIPLTFRGIRFKNPFYVASGPTTKSVQQLQRVEETGWAAASIKLTIDPDPYINRKPRYGWLKDRNALAFTTEKRLKFAEGLKLIEDAKKVLHDLILMANITYAGDDNPDGWVRMAKRFEEVGADIIELNMCCPNMSYNLEVTDSEHAGKQKTGASMGQQPAVASEIVAAVKRELKIPLFVKLTPEGGNIASVAHSLFEAGADGVGSTGNRLGVPTIDLSRPTKSNFTLQDQITIGCHSGAWLKPLAQRDTYEIRKVNGDDYFITATGGITNWQDAVEMVLCGGNLLGICAETLINGFDILEPIDTGMYNYMNEKGYKSLDDYRGSIVSSFKTASDVTLYDGYALISNPNLAAPCKIACPLHVPAQAYIQKVAKRQFKDAFDLIQAHPLQEICGLVCTHPCEDACTRANVDRSIQIRDIKRFVLEMGRKNGWGDQSASPNKLDKKVAIIGSGPSGLSAASTLAKVGYNITVYEKEAQLGGALRYGIPEFRLPIDVIDRLIQRIKNLGTQFKTEITLGKAIGIKDLFSEGVDAVILATGYSDSNLAMITGTEVPSMSGSDYLRDATPNNSSFGSTVMVVGSGIEAVDCSRKALRSGSKNVFLVMNEKSRNRSSLHEELSVAKSEGVQVFEQTKVQTVQAGIVRLLTSDNFIRDIPCDLLVISETRKNRAQNDQIQLGDEVITINKETFETSQPGVFVAGGIMKDGELANLIASGRSAAVAVDHFLRGSGATLHTQQKLTRTNTRLVLERTPLTIGNPKTVDLVIKQVTSEPLSSDLSRRVLTEDEAVEEAARCLNCGCGEGCQLCKTICCEFAPDILGPDVLGIDRDKCVACGMCAMRCPQNNIEMVNLGISRT